MEIIIDFENGTRIYVGEKIKKKMFDVYQQEVQEKEKEKENNWTWMDTIKTLLV